MSNNFAILIDGGFVRKKLESRIGNRIHRMTEEQLDCLINEIIEEFTLQRVNLYRIFYYDCLPLDDKAINPLSGDEIDFSASDISRHNKSLFSNLYKKELFAMRMGQMSLNRNNWDLKKTALKANRISGSEVTIKANDLNPNITQKGVDIKIGLDIATLALKKQISKLILVTGDSDFIPALKLARVEGLQICMVTLGHSVFDGLKQHSDFLIEKEFNLESKKFI